MGKLASMDEVKKWHNVCKAKEIVEILNKKHILLRLINPRGVSNINSSINPLYDSLANSLNSSGKYPSLT
ncbi:hypothetical protein Q604_UNBC16186G0001, partial [human gut metagenome]